MDPKTGQLTSENLRLTALVYEDLAKSLRVPLTPLPAAELAADAIPLESEADVQAALKMSNARLGKILDHMPVAPCPLEHPSQPAPPASESPDQ